MTDMLYSYFFSASNTTETLVDAFARCLGMPHRKCNLTRVDAVADDGFGAEDTVLFAAPVYAGRLPQPARDKFRNIRGNGRKCIAVVVYGNRDYDDALVELHDLLVECGFNVIAVAAFVARHSIFPDVAAGRPDAMDFARLEEFASEVKVALSGNAVVDSSLIKGSRPYKDEKAIPLHPKTDAGLCRRCGKCVAECPAGAISADNPVETDGSRCLSCSRCIVICPHGARRFGGVRYMAVAPLFKIKCASRKEPEWVVAANK